MAILFDSAQLGGYNGVAVLTRTWNHTVFDGIGRIIWVSGCVFGNEVESATYGGAAMTELSDLLDGTCHTNWFYLVNPPTGLNAVIITFAGAGCTNVSWTSASYSGVDPITPLGTLVETTNVLAAISVDVASAVDELVVDCVGRRGVGDTCNPGAGQTERAEGLNVAGRVTATSDEPGAALVTMSWALTGGSDNTTLAAVPMRPYTSARGRATKYFFPFWDANPKLFDANGKVVDPSDILVDEWVEAQGLALPSAENPDSFIEDPSRSKIIEVNATQTSARIKTNKNQFAEVLVSRVAAGS